MFPDDLLQRNQNFVSHRETSPLPHPGEVSLAVVTCFDPRLDSLLRPALGLGDDEGFFLRTPGAVVTPESPVMRSLALAVFMMGVRRVLVLGHSSCRMASFDTSTFIDIFRARGVPREAFGDVDLRSWAGAIAGSRLGALASASAIAAAPFLPHDLEIAAGVLDDSTGEIEIVLRPNEASAAFASAAAPQLSESAASEALEGVIPESPEAVPAAPEAVPASAQEVLTAVDFLASGNQMPARIEDFRDGLASEDNPTEQLALIRGFLRGAAADTGALRVALDQLSNEIRRQPGLDLAKIFLPLLERKKS